MNDLDTRLDALNGWISEDPVEPRDVGPGLRWLIDQAKTDVEAADEELNDENLVIAVADIISHFDDVGRIELAKTIVAFSKLRSEIAANRKS
jgi:hypothetical protein